MVLKIYPRKRTNIFDSSSDQPPPFRSEHLGTITQNRQNPQYYERINTKRILHWGKDDEIIIFKITDKRQLHECTLENPGPRKCVRPGLDLFLVIRNYWFPKTVFELFLLSPFFLFGKTPFLSFSLQKDPVTSSSCP